MVSVRNRVFRLSVGLCGVALLTAAGSPPVHGPTTRSSAVAPPGPVRTVTVSGTVDGYDLNSAGVPNSIVVKDGNRISQLNLPADSAALLAGATSVGQKVTAVAMPELLVGDRAIYKLVSLTVGDGKPMAADGINTWQPMHAEGTIKSLNYASRGEVDGFILDTGDFLHTGRSTAASLNLSVGQKVIADGWGRPAPGGHSVIEPTKLNEQTVQGPDHAANAVAADPRPKSADAHVPAMSKHPSRPRGDESSDRDGRDSDAPRHRSNGEAVPPPTGRSTDRRHGPDDSEQGPSDRPGFSPRAHDGRDR